MRTTIDKLVLQENVRSTKAEATALQQADALAAAAARSTRKAGYHALRRALLEEAAAVSLRIKELDAEFKDVA